MTKKPQTQKQLQNKLTKNEFSMIVESIVAKDNIGYMDAVVDYCDRTGMEIETAAAHCNAKIKACMELEASDLNLLKEKLNKLPI